jgi:hypothetical protein
VYIFELQQCVLFRPEIPYDQTVHTRSDSRAAIPVASLNATKFAKGGRSHRDIPQGGSLGEYKWGVPPAHLEYIV